MKKKRIFKKSSKKKKKKHIINVMRTATALGIKNITIVLFLLHFPIVKTHTFSLDLIIIVLCQLFSVLSLPYPRPRLWYLRRQ